MRYRVIISAEARQEAIEAGRYIEAQSGRGAAGRWFDGLVSAVGSLSSMPRRCPRARETGILFAVELRELHFHSHRLIFTIRDDEVHVLHVRHAARRKLDDL